MHHKDLEKNVRANCPFARTSLLLERGYLHAKCHIACRYYEVLGIRIQAICRIARTTSTKIIEQLQAAQSGSEHTLPLGLVVLDKLLSLGV